jgi:hypothetical protein
MEEDIGKDRIPTSTINIKAELKGLYVDKTKAKGKRENIVCEHGGEPCA